MLQNLLSYVLLYKYVAIYIITYLGAIALPMPSGSVVMAAAAFSTQGYLNFPAVLITGILGNMSGDSSNYWLVRIYGKKALKKFLWLKFITPERLKSARHQLEKHPIITIFFSRFFTGIAPAINVACAITQLDYKKYLLFEGLGEITEVSFFAGIGYLFGNNWQYISQLISGKLWLIILSGFILTQIILQLLSKHSRQ